jgi:hypothetical protein
MRINLRSMLGRQNMGSSPILSAASGISLRKKKEQGELPYSSQAFALLWSDLKCIQNAVRSVDQHHLPTIDHALEVVRERWQLAIALQR